MKRRTLKLRKLWLHTVRGFENTSAFVRATYIPLTALVLLVLLLPVLWNEVRRESTDTAKIAALVSLILMAAVAAQLGTALTKRLKKLGPLELFEQEASTLVANLERIQPRLRLSNNTKSLSPEEAYFYQEADRLISQLEFTNITVMDRHRNRLYEVLHAVAGAAMKQEEWWKAKARLEMLMRLSGGKFRLARVEHDLGVSNLQCGEFYREHGSPEKARESFQDAADHFRHATELRPYYEPSLFLLGYALARLKLFPEAVKVNARLIELKPNHGKAKYNVAVCRARLGHLALAYGGLLRIQPTDEDAEEVGRFGLTDPDLKSLLEDDKYGEPAKKHLQRLQHSQDGTSG